MSTIKLKEGLDVSTEDFWYDLTDGGYIKPEEMCANSDDAYAINQAIGLLQRFKEACEEQIEGFIQ